MSPTLDMSRPRTPKRFLSRSAWAKLCTLTVVVAGIGLGLRVLGIDATRISPEGVRGFVLSFGASAPLVYLLVYGQPIVPLPASVLTMTGGLVFGPFWGMLAALAGGTIRAYGQFLMARFLGREAVEKLLKDRWHHFDQRVGQHGFKTVFLVRLIPNFPFDIQNYGFGLSKVGFGAFALGTPLGMIPASFLLVYLGYSLTDLGNLWKALLMIALIGGLLLLQRRIRGQRQGASD